jgi:hypothetical protein
MPGPITAGVIAGLIFGLVLVWQGAGAAGLVLLFAIVGLLVGVVLWLGWRSATGQLDTDAIRSLFGVIFSNRTR